jgi:hypothetical protein
MPFVSMTSIQTMVCDIFGGWRQPIGPEKARRPPNKQPYGSVRVKVWYGTVKNGLGHNDRSERVS